LFIRKGALVYKERSACLEGKEPYKKEPYKKEPYKKEPYKKEPYKKEPKKRAL
jgi:hypothetical protein